MAGEQGVKQRETVRNDGGGMGSGSRGLRNWLPPCSVDEGGCDLSRSKIPPWLHFRN